MEEGQSNFKKTFLLLGVGAIIDVVLILIVPLCFGDQILLLETILLFPYVVVFGGPSDFASFATFIAAFLQWPLYICYLGFAKNKTSRLHRFFIILAIHIIGVILIMFKNVKLA